MPHTYVIIFSIIVLVAVATWFVPAGVYETVENADGRSVVVADSYHLVDANPQGFFDVLKAPIKGMIDAAEIIAFILIIGGTFKIVFESGRITAVVSPPQRNRPRHIYVRLRHPDTRPIQRVLLNGTAYDRFNPEKEWIVLDGAVTGDQEIVAHY